MRRMVCRCLIAMFAVAAPVLAPALARAIENVQVVALFKNSAMVKIDGKQRMLRVGATSPEGVTLISASSREAVLEIDGKRDTFVLGRQISASYVRSTDPVVRIVRGNYGMFRVTGSINGQMVDFMVDTGATNVSMSGDEATRLGIDYIRFGKEGYVSTASGIERSYSLNLAKVKVGEIALENVEATVTPGDFPDEVLLGNSFLSRLKMKNDGRTLELREAK